MPATFDVGRRKPHCPRCDKPLAPVKSAGPAMVDCATCRGVWVDRKMFGPVTSANASARKLGAARWARGNGAKAAQRIKCPVCYYWKDATDFEKCPDLVVDVCRRHGTWLDSNELQSMLRFLKHGETAPLASVQPPKSILIPHTPIKPATATALTGAATLANSNANDHQNRSTFEQTGEIILEILETAGDLADAGEIAASVAEIGFSVFSGL